MKRCCHSMVVTMNQEGYEDGGEHHHGDGGDGFDYYSAIIYNSNNEYYQQSQQQQYHQPQYYDDAAGVDDVAGYYPESQYYEEDASHQTTSGAVPNQQQHSNDNYNDINSECHHQLASCVFYPVRAPLVVHPNGTQDNYGNYDTRGDAISAIAVTPFDNDTNNAENDNDISPSSSVQSSLMYVASHSTYQGGGGSELSRAARGGGRNTATTSDKTLHRGSRLTVLYDQHDSENMQDHNVNPVMYSSFVGHPEANTNVLDGLHSVLFGCGIDIVTPPIHSAAYSTSSASTVKARSTYAFGPPFGPPSYVHRQQKSLRSGSGIITQSKRPEEIHTMGISSIFEITTPYFGSGGRICSISPYGVRVHTRGGMIMSDSKQQHGMMLSGMTCGAFMESGAHQFAVVGGMSSYYDGRGDVNTANTRRSQQHVHCVDLHRDLKIISSHTLITNSGGDNQGQENKRMCVSDMVCHAERNSIIVGCSDGTIRLLDGGRRNVEVAKAKAQLGGVAKVAIWENLIVASGYSSAGVSSQASPLPYPFPSPHVLIYDVRYLGRGGIPHVFSASRGGPRFVDFLPDGKLLAGSGQTFGSLEIITPFHNDATTGLSPSSFFQPDLNAGESMTTMNLDGGNGDLHIGTSYGRVLRYGLAEYRKTIHDTIRAPQSVLDVGSGGFLRGVGSSNGKDGDSSRGGVDKSVLCHAKEQLDIPPFVPSPPELSIDPKILCSSFRSSPDFHVQGWTVFDGYVMASSPILSSDKTLLHPRYSRSSVAATTLGPLSTTALVAPSKRCLSQKMQTKLEESSADLVKVFPAGSLDLKDLLAPPDLVDEGMSIGYSRSKNRSESKTKIFLNPNKLIYSTESFAACYDALVYPRKVVRDNCQSRELGEEDFSKSEATDIPRRYRLMIRPPFYKVTNFDYTLYNDTGIWMGWDYSLSFANSFACSVLTLLYFIEEIRSTALSLQLCSNKMSIQVQKQARRESNLSVTAELGLLFKLIESLSANGAVQPDTSSNRRNIGQVKAFVPSNFISAFALLTEAKNLALVDGVAGAAETARRPEAFYRFLMQYIDRELGQLVSTTSTQFAHYTNQGHLIDRLQGIGFLSVIEYVSGNPKISTSRALTVELGYDQKMISRKIDVKFGEILRFSLCKEAPLRAWCEETRSYEPVIQRKIATNLPSLLSLSCCCAGRKAGGLGLQVWQQENSRNWLPEFIEIHIESDNSITVKELALNEDGEEEWCIFEQSLPLPRSFFEEWEKELPQELPIKKCYRLEAVVSFVRTNSCLSDEAPHREGHHVVHVRIPADLECKALRKQLRQIEQSLKSLNTKTDTVGPMTLDSDIPLEERRKHLEEQLQKVDARETRDQWILINGFVLSKLDNSDDVRSFNTKFKEPSIVIFREATWPYNGANDVVIVEPSNELKEAILRQDTMVNVSAMETKSISGGAKPVFTIRADALPGNGDLVAIDAEFVCVQQEESIITTSGSKEVISEPRNALARLSIIHCQTNEVIIDDYVLPMEPVVDYLTRFSGIIHNDLDPNNSPHSLVTPQEAYLKVRLLMERGCIFVGHGLSQDFRIINICVPPSQIIDTAEIYHQFNQRYISLRYLTNYVLGRDMQQEVHDSIEDARAAYELYRKALSLKKEGKFQEYLMNLYAHGHSTQFKLGVAK